MASPAQSSPGRWCTRANALTSLRLLAAAPLALAILGGEPVVAAALFALAVATDFADGPVARRFGESSPLGGLLDHASDASFVSIGLGALAAVGAVPRVLPILVALAFLQYALDSGSLRLARGGGAPRALRASSLGRWNGIAYYVLLGTPLIRDLLGLGWPSAPLVHGLGMALVISTLVSMADRLIALLRSREAA